MSQKTHPSFGGAPPKEGCPTVALVI